MTVHLRSMSESFPLKMGAEAESAALACVIDGAILEGKRGADDEGAATDDGGACECIGAGEGQLSAGEIEAADGGGGAGGFIADDTGESGA